jgi:hypothetical protein
MSTPAQANASRANGALSQGPVTIEGKAHSSQNALNHGLRSAAVVLPTEDPKEFARHQAAYIDDFRPATQSERDLVETMAAARWRMKRLIPLEVQLLQGDNPERALGVITRYEGQLNRSYEKAYNLLEALQSNRPKARPAAPRLSPSKPSASPEPNEPGDAHGDAGRDADIDALLDALTAPPQAQPRENTPKPPVPAAPPASGASPRSPRAPHGAATVKERHP